MLSIGDKVKIKSDLTVGKKYGSDTFIRGMYEYIGLRTIISGIRGSRYALEIDGERHNWTEEMVEYVPDTISIVTSTPEQNDGTPRPLRNSKRNKKDRA